MSGQNGASNQDCMVSTIHVAPAVPPVNGPPMASQMALLTAVAPLQVPCGVQEDRRLLLIRRSHRKQREDNNSLRFLLPRPVLGTALSVATLVFKVIDDALIREID